MRFSGWLAMAVVALVSVASAENLAERSPTPHTVPAMLDALEQDDPAKAAAIAQQADKGDNEALFVAGLLQDIGAGVRMDHAAALKTIERAAEQYPLARHYLRWRAESGFGVDKPNPAEQARWRAAATGVPVLDRGLDHWLVVNGEAVVPQFKRALLWMMNEEDQNVVAQGNLADAYLDTWWTKPDPQAHMEWLGKAAAGGDPRSLGQLALYYELGLFVTADPVRARQYRMAAAKAGDAKSEIAIADAYLTGDGVAKSPSDAVQWLRAAAAQDDVEALLKLADLLRTGSEGVVVDRMEGYRLAQRAAELGSAEGMADVGLFLHEGVGTKKDLKEAAAMFQKAAEHGNAYGADMLGFMLQTGELGAPDFPQARRWFQQAAAAGNEHARVALGTMLLNGTGGDKNPSLGFEWIEKAARDGDAGAQNELGWCLRQGIGIEADNEEAVNWFQLAAKKGNPMAEANLGYQYLEGLGVAKDIREAARHLIIAGRQLDDQWTESIFKLAFAGAAPTDVPALRKMIDDCMADPEFMKRPGALPEMCLSALEDGAAGISDQAAAAKLFATLRAAKRPQSALTIAMHAFYGKDMPYDLDAAHVALADAKDISPNDRQRTLASMDSIAAPDPQEREKARAALHTMADGGDKLAAGILVERYLSGIGEPYDAVAARKYYDLGHAGSPSGGVTFEQLNKSNHRPKPPTGDELQRLIAAHLDPNAKDHRIVPVYQAPPNYPFELRRAGVTGEAQVDFVVDAQGMPTNVHCVKSTQPLFALSAVDAVQNWRFVPAYKNGAPVATHMVVPIIFNLSDE